MYFFLLKDGPSNLTPHGSPRFRKDTGAVNHGASDNLAVPSINKKTKTNMAGWKPTSLLIGDTYNFIHGVLFLLSCYFKCFFSIVMLVFGKQYSSGPNIIK